VKEYTNSERLLEEGTVLTKDEQAFCCSMRRRSLTYGAPIAALQRAPIQDLESGYSLTAHHTTAQDVSGLVWVIVEEF